MGGFNWNTNSLLGASKKFIQWGLPPVAIIVLTVLLSHYSQEISAQGFKCIKNGKFKDPDNERRYHQCFHLYGEQRYIHNTCPEGTCFSETLNYCIASACQNYRPPSSYNCSGLNYLCSRIGVFGHPLDYSVYFRCLMNKQGHWDPVCYGCNRKRHTCFHNGYCLPNDGQPCGSDDTVVIKIPETPGGSPTIPEKTTEKSKTTPPPGTGTGGNMSAPGTPEGGNNTGDTPGTPEEKETTPTPGGDVIDIPVNESTTVSPDKETTLSPTKRTTSSSSDNMGPPVGHGNDDDKGRAATYDCEGYDDFPCAKLGPGTHGKPGDPSVYFVCSKEGDKFVQMCHTCPEENESYFVESEKRCIENRGKGPHHKPYHCGTYSDSDFDCTKGEGVHEFCNDTSIFYECVTEGDQLRPYCYSCGFTTCFVEEKSTCLQHPGPCPNTCTGEGGKDKGTGVDKDEDKKMKGDGGNKGNKGDKKKNKDDEKTNKGKDKKTKDDGNKKDDNKDDKNKGGGGKKKKVKDDDKDKGGEPEGDDDDETDDQDKEDKTSGSDEDENEIDGPDIPTEGFSSYNCSYFHDESIPCNKLGPIAGEGPYATLADISVYFMCSQMGQRWLAECYTCPRESHSCFDPKAQKCRKYCGSRPYDCRLYKKSPPPCKIQGRFFANADDTTIYFECKLVKGKLVSLCYTCSSTAKTCYSERIHNCVSCGNKELIDGGKDSDETGGPPDKDGKDSDEDEGPPGKDNKDKGGGPPGKDNKDKGGSPPGKDNKDKGGSPPGKDNKDKGGSPPGKGDKDGGGPMVETTTQSPGGTTKRTSMRDRDVFNGTYSCDGYKSDSFPCYGYPSGTYAMPGDSSVYVVCVPSAKGDEDISNFVACYTCDTSKCYFNDKHQCDLCYPPEVKTTVAPVTTEKTTKPTTTQPMKNESATTSKPIKEEQTTKKSPEPEKPSTTKTPEKTTKMPEKTTKMPGKPKEPPAGPPETPSEPEKEDRIVLDPYTCTGATYECLAIGLFVSPDYDTSIYFECRRIGRSTLTSLCYTCATNLCFSVALGKCIDNGGTECRSGDDLDNCRDDGHGNIECDDDNIETGTEGKGGMQGTTKKPGSSVTTSKPDGGNKATTAKPGGGKDDTTENIGGGESTTVKTGDHVGQDDPSLTRNCSRYNLEESFPCSKLPSGYHGLPGDRSIFFECFTEQGIQMARCYSCSKEGNSIYDPKTEVCKKMVGKNSCCEPDSPLGNADLFFQELVPYFHHCYNLSGIWRNRCSYCKLSMQCLGKCLTRNDETYSFFNDKYPVCQGLNATTEFFHQHWETYYFNCLNFEGGWRSRCQTCLGGMPFCEGHLKHKKYDCSTYRNTKQYISCIGKEKGKFYPNPVDSSTFFLCTQQNNEWRAYCFACNFREMSTFSPELGTCSTDGKTYERRYACDEYKKSSFPCYKGEGTYSFPGDKSLYYTCPPDALFGDCRSCSKDDKACYIEGEGCLVDCGNCIKTPYRYSYMDDLIPKCPKGTPFPSPEDLMKDPVPLYFNCLLNGNSGPWSRRCRNCHVTPNYCKTEIITKIPYNCRSISNFTSRFLCKHPGVFAVPTDTSMMIECKLIDGKYERYCYACPFRTCFHESLRKCVAIKDGKPCGSKFEHPPPEVIGPGDTNGYSCSGLTKNSFPCGQLSPGTYSYPADDTIYFVCHENGADCKSCIKSRDEYFNVTSLTCEQPPIDPSKIPYQCDGRNAMTFIANCSNEGTGLVFADPRDGGSVYYQCSKVYGKWKIACFPCWSTDEVETCFNNGLGACAEKVKEGEGCKSEDADNPTGKMSTRSYSCERYNHNWNESCVQEGKFAVPGDRSIYIECRFDGEKFSAECYSCENETMSIYVNEKSMCVENNGEGVKVNGTKSPYRCLGYNLHSYPCRHEGKFVHPEDPSVFFNCVFEKGMWASPCYECNSASRSVFIPWRQRCIDQGNEGGGTPTDGDDDGEPSKGEEPTGGEVGGGELTGGGDSQVGGSPPTSGGGLPPTKIEEDPLNGNRSYGDNCVGYSATAVPCFWLTKRYARTDIMFEHIGGDRSVYFHCTKIKEGWISFCHRCPLLTCFDQELQVCSVEACNNEITVDIPGPYEPYDCNFYGENSYPCTEAGVFSNPAETSVYFQCVPEGSAWKSVCYTCNSKTLTCYDESRGQCISKGGKKCGSGIIIRPPRNGSHPGPTPPINHPPTNTSLPTPTPKPPPPSINDTTVLYDCEGYDPKKIPVCKTFGIGHWGLPGDHSVYFDCGKTSLDPAGTCHVCNSTFDLQTIFKTTTIPNIFKEMKSTKVFYTHCIKDGYSRLEYWKKRCVFSVEGGVELKSCFDPKQKTCVDCRASKYRPYDCTMYDTDRSFKCDIEGYFAQIFDSSVFFKCVKEGKNYKAYCHTCDSHHKTCFSNKLQTCITKGGKACGSGGDPAMSGLGGSSKDSRKHSCLGFNNHSVPCAHLTKLGTGSTFPTPADRSVYFHCDASGKASCTACPEENDSCFVESTINPGVYQCIPNCGKGIPRKYQCGTYGQMAFTCKKEGYFANPESPDVFFQCVRSPTVPGVLTSLCHSCNMETQTCYSEEHKACIPCRKEIGGGGGDNDDNGGMDEGNNIGGGDGFIQVSLSYACIGYDEFAYPCYYYGVGKHSFFADRSVYFECKVNDGILKADCRSCNRNKNEIFDPILSKCVANWGRGEYIPYDCSRYGDKSYPCSKEGYFAANDSSVFFKCVRLGNQWQAQCFACSNHGSVSTCFYNQKCVRINTEAGQTCKSIIGEGTGVAIGPEDVTPYRTYSCAGYLSSAFPCAKYPDGNYAHPGDDSVWFKCQNKVATCQACPHGSCYIPEKQACIENCGLGPHRPYICSTYSALSYHCHDGISHKYVASLQSTSVFLKCVRDAQGRWEVLCYTCSSTRKTCFSESLQTCITNDGEACGKGDPAFNPDSGIEEDSRTYECSGYGPSAFPCGKKVTPLTNGHPGDKSVHFTCENIKGKLQAVCHSCSKAILECYVKGKCAAYCGQEFPTRHVCSTYDYRSIECVQEGTTFLQSHVADTSVYFQCVKVKGSLLAVCMSCSYQTRSCFSESKQACLVMPDKNHRCMLEDPAKLATPGFLVLSRNDSCASITTNFPCKYFSVNYQFAMIDKKTYGECVFQNGKLVPQCQTCPGLQYFDSEKKSCVEEKMIPFSCKTHTGSPTSFNPCTTTGFFPHPKEASIYIQCYNIQGKFYFACYTCPPNSCFDQGKKLCVVRTQSVTRCGPPRTTSGRSMLASGRPPARSSMSWSCDNYKSDAFEAACKTLSYGQYANPGDRSTYIQCLPGARSNEIIATCKACPHGSVYNEVLGKCIGQKAGYNCALYHGVHYHCPRDKDGKLVANKADSSLYFLCLKIKDVMHALCYACNEEEKTCFSEKMQKCLPVNDGEPCGNRDPADMSQVDVLYKGYHCGYGGETKGNKIFPCSLYGAGTHLLPGDRTVSIQCDSRSRAKCIACNKDSNGCFDEKAGRCVSDCSGSTLSKVVGGEYDCKAYKTNRPNCTSENVLAHPADSSVHLRCVRNMKHWLSLCYPCPSGTCFDNKMKACLKAKTSCGSADNTEVVGSVMEGRSYNCKSFTSNLFPCKRLRRLGGGPFLRHAVPGDESVWFICPEGSHGVCHECPSGLCFSETSQLCVKCQSNNMSAVSTSCKTYGIENVCRKLSS